ncbi:MAG: hypothetical protein QM817_35250 [Archangium sp.]
MSRPRFLRAAVLAFALISGCTCGPLGIDSTRFACESDADCTSGFVCADIGGGGAECVRPEQVIPPDTSDAGDASDAGTPDAGTPDAGAMEDAGNDDAGADAGDDAGFDAGDVDAGFDAGEDAGVDAGPDDAGFDAGVDAGVDAGIDDAGPPASRLAITTPPQTTATGACSQVFLVETRDLTNAATPVMMNTTVTLDGGTSGLLSFYASSNCGGAATTTVTVPSMQSLTTFYARGSDAGTFVITASAAGLTATTQTFTVMNPPTSLVFTSTPPSTVRGGTCLTASIEARRGTVATPVTSNTTVSLTPTTAGAVRFYSDSACANSITTLQLATGESLGVFFMKPLTGGMQTITAAAPFGSVMQTINVTSIVRRSSCVIPPATLQSDGGIANSLSVTCTISPALVSTAAAMLFTQATALTDGGTGVLDGGLVTDGGVGAFEPRCRIATTTTMTCNRAQDNAATEIHFQVAEIPANFSGQRVTTTGCPALATFPTPITTTKSFVLKTTQSDSVNFDDDDTLSAELISTTQVGLSPNACTGADVQLLFWDGLTVTRGRVDGGMPLGVNSVTVSGLPAVGTNTALLVAPSTTLDGQRQMCSAMIRASSPSTTSLTFTRGQGDAGCVLTAMENLFWERIDFGSRAVVRQFTTTFSPGEFRRNVTITPVDTTRSVVFSSAQLVGGQGTGESDEGGPSNWLEGGFQTVLTATNNVQVIRTSANSTASITFYVAELLP